MSENYVIANRGDGLGERLCAIYNGLLVSELTGLPFKFYWPVNHTQNDKHHSVPLVNEIFSDDFIELYHEESVANKYPLLEFKRLKLDDLVIDLNNQLSVQSMVVSQTNSFGRVLSSDPMVINKIKESIADKMDFCDDLKAVLAESKRVDLPKNITAIHLRSGDIVYGRFAQSTQFYHKVICTPMAKLMMDSSVDGSNYILVGQEPEFAKKMDEVGLAIDANRLSKDFNFNAVEQAFFDFGLISRCDFKIDGNSGFTRLAQFLGTVKTKKTNSINSQEKWASLIYNELIENNTFYTPEQIGFSASLCYDYTYDNRDVEQSIKYLTLAVESYPSNILYWVLLIINHYRSNDSIGAKTVEEKMKKTSGYTIHNLAKNKDFIRMLQTKAVGSTSKKMFDKYESIILAAQKEGYDFANLLYANIFAA
jgi:hypothetical protein